jgi:CRP-like cAMP-binding protein
MSNYKSDINALRQVIGAILPIDEAIFKEFSAIWQPYEAKRKTILTYQGDVEQYVYFVTKGVQRAYAVREDGRDVTLVFSYPFSFSGVADSFLLQQPSHYFLETLTPSAFLCTSFAQLDGLMQRHHLLERLFRLAISHTLAGVLERQIELQSFSAEQRFKALLKRSPHVLQMIPHKYLASYLGIDATNFSKMLATIKVF